jgi:hypothetical protein
MTEMNSELLRRFQVDRIKYCRNCAAFLLTIDVMMNTLFVQLFQHVLSDERLFPNNLILTQKTLCYNTLVHAQLPMANLAYYRQAEHAGF